MAHRLSSDAGQTASAMSDLVAVRDNYLRNGVADATVRPVVLESWMRCREYRLDPGKLRSQAAVSGALETAWQANRDLLDHAIPLLEKIHEKQGDKPHVLVLADREGYILRLWSASIPDGGQEAAIYEGASWHERDIGCNGIGTCLATGKPVVLIGPEHFQDAYVDWTCIGIPLHGPGGAIVGAVDLSVPNERLDTETWGWALTVARDIDRNLAGETGGHDQHPDENGLLNSLLGVMELLVGELNLSPTHFRLVENARSSLAEALNERGRTDEMLRSSETRYRLLSQTTNDVIWDWNLTTGELLWNDALERVFGYPPEEVGNRIEWWHERIHPEDREQVVESVESVIADPAMTSWVEEYRFRHYSGEWLTVLDRGLISRAENGYGVRMLGTMLDLTERVRREEELHLAVQRFETLANMMPQIVWSTRPDGYHDYFNERWYEYTGMPREGDQGWNWKNYLHPDDVQRSIETWQRSLETGKFYEIQYRFRRASDGVYRWFIGRAMPILDRDGKITRWFGTCTDIEDQRREEERLERLVAERTHELQQQAMRLRQLAAELGSAEQRERRRLAALLHDDLQQVLVAAKMQIGQLVRHVENSAGLKLAEQAKDWIDEASETARGLSRELRPPALYEGGLPDALQWLSSEMENKHRLEVRIERCDLSEKVSDDVKALVFECTRELLFNAAKYAGTGEVSVSLWAEGNWLRLRVSDHGCGFDVGVLAERGGSQGYGLFSIRERLVALGGAMTIESAPGDGTRAKLEVPLSPEYTEPSATPVAPVEAAPRQRPAIDTAHVTRVLVVDDHVVVRKGVAAILEGDDRVSVVAQASDGIQAIEAVERHNPDVILMDLNMPRMNGIDATREIHSGWPEVVVIGLSVQDDEATAQAMRNAGAAAFLPKAGDSEKMIATILELARSPERDSLSGTSS